MGVQPKACWLNLIRSIYHWFNDIYNVLFHKCTSVYIYIFQTGGINTKKICLVSYNIHDLTQQKCFTLSNFPSAEVPGFLQELSRNHRYRGDFDTKATLRHG